MNENQGFGFQDDNDESLQAKGGNWGHFGLNQNASLKLFEYNPNAGKDGGLADAIDITIMIGDNEYRRRIYDITKVYIDNNEITDKDSPEWKEAYQKEWKQNGAFITHLLKAFMDESVIKAALATPLNSFADYARVVTGLITPTMQEANKIDVFLEWQWNIPQGKEQTYLQLPKNMKGGYWICKAQPGIFKAVIDSKGLHYVNENNVRHPFTKTVNFMKSNKAVQQTVTDNASSTDW